MTFSGSFKRFSLVLLIGLISMHLPDRYRLKGGSRQNREGRKGNGGAGRRNEHLMLVPSIPAYLQLIFGFDCRCSVL
ncbi:hypothetical protein B0T26DRAFT_716936 [Lasiosphaeria miniovina]|uniref:Secreted protein n=1 Tax=Lasiosphaeria miniovina TaxID=1954250 RepID=A0AA40ACC9_9PEZI|nr:uncharacterized protein B0T26DRAFT_716936 [Lasiosphaeria miniovina]KAK0713273.1 hypothetical protein B0T26DRAFT_716936 [Lasiosphaeria miniovina]